jgi:hypothetical protein
MDSAAFYNSVAPLPALKSLHVTDKLLKQAHNCPYLKKRTVKMKRLHFGKNSIRETFAKVGQDEHTTANATRKKPLEVLFS